MRWLLISYTANVEASACSQHLDDKLPALRLLGIEPVLLSSPCGARHAHVVHHRTPSLSPAGIRVELRKVLQRSLRNTALRRLLQGLLFLPLLPLYLFEKRCRIAQSEWSWSLLACWRGRRLIRRYRPQLIYSTGGPVCAHIAARRLARESGLPWIADLQDPLLHDEDDRRPPWLREYYRRLEAAIRRESRATVFTTRAHREHSNRRVADASPGWAIYPGADPAVLPARQRSLGTECRLAHFGAMGGTRNLAVLLPAMEQVLEEHPQWADRLRLDLFGGFDRLSQCLLAESPCAKITTVHGKVPRAQALQQMVDSDCLLLLQNTEYFATETFPSKVYEYLLAGRPILALVHRNAELRELLAGETVWIAEASSAAQVAEALVALLSAHEAGLLEHSRPRPHWTAKRAMQELLGCLQGCAPQAAAEPAAGFSAGLVTGSDSGPRCRV